MQSGGVEVINKARLTMSLFVKAGNGDIGVHCTLLSTFVDVWNFEISHTKNISNIAIDQC